MRRFTAEELISLHSRRWVIEVLFWGIKRRLGLGGGKGMLFKTIRSQMIITSLRCMPLKLDRRIENEPPSFCTCCRPIREKMRGIPYGRSCTEDPAFPLLADQKPAEEALN